MKSYRFRTVPLSIIRNFSLYTQQWYKSANLYDMYHCCVYSEKLLMMDRGTVRNMQIFNPKINVRNQCILQFITRNHSPVFKYEVKIAWNYTAISTLRLFVLYLATDFRIRTDLKCAKYNAVLQYIFVALYHRNKYIVYSFIVLSTLSYLYLLGKFLNYCNPQNTAVMPWC